MRLAIIGLAAGAASALLQLPIPNSGVTQTVVGSSVGWPWYLSSNLLLAVEAMLAVGLAVAVASWRQHRPDRPPGARDAGNLA